MTILSRALSGVLLSLVVTSAHADIMFSATPSGTGTNVVFNLQQSNQTGLTVFGNLNDAANTLVHFTSTQTLISPAQGQARIESLPDGILNNLTTTIPGSVFDAAVFNLDATANGSATINVLNQANVLSTFMLPLTESGQNFFTLTAVNDQHISSVSVTSTVGLDDVSQIRVGGLAVPGPIASAGLPGLLAACVGLIVLARRRRFKLI